MTPLAWELFEDLSSRDTCHVVHTPFIGWYDTSAFLNDALRQSKFFDCAAITPLIGELATSMAQAFEEYNRVDQRFAFLPAPMTWIECEMPSVEGLVSDEDRAAHINEFLPYGAINISAAHHHYRIAWILVGQDNSTHVAQRYRLQYNTLHRQPGPRKWRLQKLPVLPLVHSGLKPQRSCEHSRDGIVRVFDQPVAAIEDFCNYATLALINTPRVIGQKQHNPNERAERDKLKKMKLVGQFPLRAWTEIVLRVATYPNDRDGAPAQETHLTGERCLHYCRTYLRVRMGMLEYVEGHWRGNPALGTKRSRYRLQKEPSQ
jgi:hypothetical protein